MSIFNRDEDGTAPPPVSNPGRPAPASRQNQNRQPTHVAEGSRLKGEIGGSTEVLIDGSVDGRVKVGSQVEVGAKGEVKGEIEAKLVRVGGKVVGNVRGQERVEILDSGHVEGDVAAPRVIIADGAFFKGNVEMGGQNPETPSSPKAKPGGGGGGSTQ